MQISEEYFENHLYQKEKPQPAEIPEVQKILDTEKTADFLAEGGTLASFSEYFEERPTQIALLKDICGCFNQSKIGVFEAGTGVGKSYAYLIPSMLWALQNYEKVLISTGTINLQQQLIEKDIPATEKIIGQKVKAILLKGRQNYICLRRLSDSVQDNDLFTEAEEIDELEKVSEWAKKCKSGSRTDLDFMPIERVWTRVNSEPDACLGNKCAFFERCFVMKVRKEAAAADLLIVNHHLLFADIQLRSAGLGYEDAALLPSYKRIVFDEAHGMEDAATSFFSEQFTHFTLQKQLNNLYRVRKGAAAGHLFTLEALSAGEQSSANAMALIQQIKVHMQDLEESALKLLERESTWRLHIQTQSNSADLLQAFKNLRSSILQCTGVVLEVIEGIPEKDRIAPAVWESQRIVSRLHSIADLCRKFTEWDERNDTVFWLELVRTVSSGVFPRFIATPLDIAPLMQKGVFEPLETVVCVSATLQTANSFDFWLKRSGAAFTQKERLAHGVFDSPFNHRKNMLLSIPCDTPLPDSIDFQSYIESAIIKLIESAGGRTLVLFTSYESLKSACSRARAELAQAGICVLQQGDDDRFRLLEQFKQDTASVLFATDSFWQGVDVPGESLSQVIIVKLPFSVPSDPVFAARSEAIEKSGASSFMSLSLPQAIIKFRQGVGRLLRRKSDRGSVVLLDKRITTKPYGKIFLQSIPETKILNGTLKEAAKQIERFLNA